MRHLANQNGRRAVNWRVRAERLRTVPLLVVLEELGATPDPHDPAKWHTDQGVLSLSGPKFMNWNQGIGGGGAIDLVMHVRQLSFGQALEWLERHFASLTPPQTASMARPQALTLPAPTTQNWPRVEGYLVEERKLHWTLLAPLVQSGIIYADLQANAVFLLLDPNATPVGAELRGATGVAWRGMAAGSRKDRGFFSLPSTPGQAIVLCESAIDAISCHAFHPAYRCLSTSGARPDPQWLRSLLEQGQPIYCGFDADPTGDLMAQRMCDLHPSIRRLRPAAKDWNDLLRHHV